MQVLEYRRTACLYILSPSYYTMFDITASEHRLFHKIMSGDALGVIQLREQIHWIVNSTDQNMD